MNNIINNNFQLPNNDHSYSPPHPPLNYGTELTSTSNNIGLSLLSSYGVNFLVSFIAIFLVTFAKRGDMSGITLLTDMTSMTGQVFTFFSYITMFVPAIFIGFRLLKLPAKVVFPLRKTSADIIFTSIGMGFGASIIGSVLVAVIYEILVSTTGYGPVYPLDFVPRGFSTSVMFFINFAILPSIIEELLFRGVIMQSLRRYGDKFALIASSILFGLAHGNLAQAPNAIVLGLVMGYFTLYSGSLIPAMLMHFANNSTATILQLIMRDTTTTQDNVLSVGLVALRLLFGILSVIYFSAKRNGAPMFYIPPSQYPLKEGQKYKKLFFAAAIITYIAIVTFMTITNMKPVDASSLSA